MSKSKNVHVVPHGPGQWAVETEGASRPARVTSTQEKAIEAGRDIAKGRAGELSIHGRDGRIRDKESYGNDPCPPRDKD
ncbi:MAG: DUF2188 domain-containing protein [Bacillota bacterium]